MPPPMMQPPSMPPPMMQPPMFPPGMGGMVGQMGMGGMVPPFGSGMMGDGMPPMEAHAKAAASWALDGGPCSLRMDTMEGPRAHKKAKKEDKKGKKGTK